MYFGADYYPEHWPKDRWKKDAELMAGAGMNVVRLGEFAWAKLEPEPGSYDFTWLDEAVGILSAKGIGIVLGTPTATPPKWLMDAFPGIYPKDEFGRIRGFGTRCHYCHSSPDYRRETVRIVSEMARHYAGNPAVVAWQIDNELGNHGSTRCYCDTCRAGFAEWLRKRYGTIDRLNEEWGTVFWSQTYRSFDEVILPGYSMVDGQTAHSASENHNPGLLLDFYRFSSDSVISYQKLQIDEIRRHSKAPITHNFMGHFSDVDYFGLAKDLDFVSWDNYPTNQWGTSDCRSTAFAHDIMRGTGKKNFWVMEEQSGPCGWNVMGESPAPEQIRLWTFQAIARGAEGMVYFRWRACTFGIEQYWHGILGHDGVPRRRYNEIKRIGEELPGIVEWIDGSVPDTEIALVKSYEDWWSHQIQPHARDFTYGRILQNYYDACWANGTGLDVVSPESDFSKYRVVIAPALNLMDNALKERLEDFVTSGGRLLTTFRSGTRTKTNRMTEIPIPGYLKDLTGIEVEEFDVLRNGRSVEVSGKGISGNATVWCDIIDPGKADVLLSYREGWFRNKAAVTENTFGKGKAVYVGCGLDPAALAAVVSRIMDGAGVERWVNRGVPDVEVVRKRNNGRRALFILNHSDELREVTMDGSYADLLTGEETKPRIELEAYGVRILVERIAP